MLQAGFGSNVLRGVLQFTSAQRCEQITREDEAPTGLFGQPLFSREIGALARRILDLATKAQVTQPLAATDQLLVEPSGADHARLPLDWQVRFQFHGHAAAQALRIVLAAPLSQISGHIPAAFGHAFHDASPAQGFQSAHVRRHDLARVAVGCGLTLGDSQVMIGAVHAIDGIRPTLRAR